MRPGLAILPGLVRYDEAYTLGVTDIQHAFRVTVRATNGTCIPRRTRGLDRAARRPWGARLRLKAGKDISDSRRDQKIFRAMKRYGLIVADNGSDMYITGTFDIRWNNDVLNPAFGALKASDFEVVQLGWKPAADQATLSTLTVSPSSVVGGQGFDRHRHVDRPCTDRWRPPSPSRARNATVASVPASVTVAAGATSTSFAVTTSTVASTTLVASALLQWGLEDGDRDGDTAAASPHALRR
jgi:hypothetical protein